MSVFSYQIRRRWRRRQSQLILKSQPDVVIGRRVELIHRIDSRQWRAYLSQQARVGIVGKWQNVSAKKHKNSICITLDRIHSQINAIKLSSEVVRKCLNILSRRIHRSQQGLRRSPGSSESGKQMFNSPSSSSSSSSSEGRQGRSPTPNLFRRGNASRQHQSARTNHVSPDSHQSRVRRSRSLQLPEKRSPGTSAPQRDHPQRETNDAHRVVVKIVNDRGSERSKRHILQNSAYRVTFSYIFRVS
jgi:hypothetical protein